MIVVTRLNETQFAVNPDLIERCYASPDTHLAMVGGTTYVVTETVDAVINLIINYRAQILALANDMGSDSGQRRLSLVPSPNEAKESPGSVPTRPGK